MMKVRWMTTALLCAGAAFLTGCPTTPPMSAPSVVSVSIDQGDQQLQVGTSTSLTATVEVVGNASEAVVWSSSADGVASVSDGGVVTGESEGTAVIMVESTFDASASDGVTITVIPGPDDRTFIDDTERPSDELPSYTTTISVLVGDDDDPDAEVQQITAEVVDGLAIFEGDIILGSVGEVSTLGMVHVSRRNVWPGAVVPYAVDEAFSEIMTGRIDAAIAHWEENTPVRFVLRDDHADFVHFVTDANSCSSWVGRIGGEQQIRLANGCSLGNTIHEIGHAVGLWHEQSRGDRDDHVEILFDNILDGRQHNFDQRITWGVDVGAYDFGSIMHYGPFAFGRRDADGVQLQTIVTRPAGIPIGQRSGLSAGDIDAVRQLYVPPQPETFTATPPEIVAGASVEFAWRVDVPGVPDLRCLLDVTGDGQPDVTRSGPDCHGSHTLRHTYSSAGRYQVTLTVDDGIGLLAQATATVVVRDAPDVSVRIDPAFANLGFDEALEFTATVTGTGNTAVTWSTTCGSVSGSGNTVTYVAPATEGTCLVRATSIEATSAWAEATVVVVDPGSPAWRASPAQLDFFADLGDPAPPPQTFTLHNDGTAEGSFTLNAGGMAQVSPTSDTVEAGGSRAITVSVTACPDLGTTTSVITLPGSPVTIGVSRTCGEPEPDVGMLQVIITGLPSGVDADVFITGQGWMLWPTTSILLSDMQPGWYEMTAGPVTASGATYEPSLANESFLVEAGQTTTVTIAYTVTSVDPGQLGVTINGLPTGVDANTLVTGPNGYSQPITRSTTLTVPPGTYTITATDVSSGGTTYVATPTSQQRTVTSNGTTGATVTYAADLVPVDVWFNIGGRGSVRVGDLEPCTADCTRYVPAEAPVSIVATADAGFLFTGWADACEHAGANTTCTITPTEYTRVIANFAQRTIDIDYTMQGTGSGLLTATFESKQETCSGSCTIGPVGVPTVVVLEATPGSGHTFAGWGGACADAGTNALCMLSLLADASDQTVTARFDVVQSNRPPTIDEVWLRYQSGERFECGSIIPQEYIGFYWRSSDPDGDTVTHQYRVDDGTWSNRNGTSVNLWLDDRPPGTLRTLQVRAIDSYGNVSAASSCTARVSMPPEIIDYAGPTNAMGYRAGETAAFAVDIRDADGHYPSEVILMLRRDGSNVATLQMALQFDQGPATKLTYVTTYRFTVAGSYDYLIWVTDALGVMADTTDRVPFTIYP